ncbi:MAG: ABC transporter permease [Anaerolineales bacterium]|nr:ABC transporter permease [Anaerolineales bacterium]
MVSAWGFFFLPLLIVVPNAQAVKNVSFQLLELQGDYRYAVLFFLSLVPMVVGFQSNQLRRGWLLVGLGNLMMILALWLPAVAAKELLANALDILPTDTFVRNPRVRPVSGVAVGLMGGYIVLFSGLLDLRKAGVSQVIRFFAGIVGFVGIYWLFDSGRLDAFSIVLEYRVNGDNLSNNLIKQLTYVLVSLITGLVIGVGLGLWASRQARVAPIILYVVGIIQTIPSLALFGLLLVPLSNLGRQQIVDDMLVYVIPALIGVSVLFVIVERIGKRYLPDSLHFGALVVLGVGALVPFFLSTLMVISLLFQVSLRMLTNGTHSMPKTIFLMAFVGLFALTLLGRRTHALRRRPLLRRRLRLALTVAAFGAALVTFALTANDYLPTEDTFSVWTLSDIGIKGLGETPSLVALSLYSLLPLVRNTYAGLNNVDNAIIDSGRGMGMTPRQIFFKIELPLAFPVIMAGVRSAAIALVGIATIAAVIGGGALGEYVVEGANRISLDLILLGTLPAILLAFMLDAGLRALEAFLTSPGIRQQGQGGL